MTDTERREPPRRRRRVHALLAVNGVLLLLLAAVTFSPTSEAQVQRRGDYTMVAGGVQGIVGDMAVYIVDTKNRELIAVGYDPNEKELLGIGYRNIAADTASLQRTGPR